MTCSSPVLKFFIDNVTTKTEDTDRDLIGVSKISAEIGQAMYFLLDQFQRFFVDYSNHLNTGRSKIWKHRK